MTDSLEAVQHAAVVCDARGRIVGINAVAEKLVGAMIRPREMTLSFHTPRCADAFGRMMQDALRPHVGTNLTPLAVDVQDPQGNHLTMRAIRIKGLGRFLSLEGAVLILINAGRRRRNYWPILSN